MDRSTDNGAADANGLAVERLLRRLFDEAVRSALPEYCLPSALPAPPVGRTIVVGAGKASAAMARVVERNWPGALEGVVVTRYGHGVPCEHITILEAGHPIPDEAGMAATQSLLSVLDGLTADDLVLCLISGGGSALLVAPPPGIALAEIQLLTDQLLRSGASIAQINCVRKHLSLVAGGRLARRAMPARLVTLAISDVPGDDPGTIASGPTVVDTSAPGEALAILDSLGLSPATAIRQWLERSVQEEPLADEDGRHVFRLVASPQQALQTAADAAARAGYTPLILGSAIEGEAREVAKVHAGIVRQVKLYGQPVQAPCVILSGGETSVTVRGNGRGGRNGEFLLALLAALDGEADVHALAADTDGIDGVEENAGARIGPDTLQAARKLGVSCESALAQSDSHGFFSAVDALVVTGPTHTNVNDFRAIAVGRAAEQGKAIS